MKLAKDGAIIPLNDLVEQHMPNFKRVLEEAPAYKSMITAPDGNIYAFPWIEELGNGKERIQAVDSMPCTDAASSVHQPNSVSWRDWVRST